MSSLESATPSLVVSNINVQSKSRTFSSNTSKPHPATMTLGALMTELQSYDIDVSTFHEKRELVRAVLKARIERTIKPIVKDEPNESVPKSVTPTPMDINIKSKSETIVEEKKEEKEEEKEEEINDDEKAEENEEISYKSYRVSFNSNFSILVRM